MRSRDEAADLLDAARRLEPLVASLRDGFDKERRLPPELVDAIGGAGLFSMWLPRALGGPELPPISFLEVIEELARQDGSVGWCTVIPAGYGRLAGGMPQETAGDIFGSGRAVLVGTLNPAGKAVPVPGGYRVTGRWSYGSFIAHSQWVLGGCVVQDDPGAAVAPVHLSARGGRDLRYLACRRPARHRQQRLSGRRCFRPRRTGSADPGIFACGGAAGGAVCGADAGHFRILYRHRRTRHRPGRDRGADGDRVGEDADRIELGPAREALRASRHGRAEALVRSGRAFLFDALGACWDDAQAGRTVTLHRRALVRLAACQATQNAVQAVDLMYACGGGTSLFEGNRLERCFRDAHAGAQHFAVAPLSNLEPIGRVLFGLDPGRAVLIPTGIDLDLSARSPPPRGGRRPATGPSLHGQKAWMPTCVGMTWRCGRRANIIAGRSRSAASGTRLGPPA